MRGRRRSLALWAAAFVSIAAVVGGARLVTRSEPLDIPAAIERLFDQRTDGERAVAAALARLDAAPNDAHALAGLAAAYLFRVRETADPSYYAKAGALLDRAIALAPKDPDVALTAGSLALSRHDFAAGLRWAQTAASVAPDRPAVYGVMTDALVELGRYDEAIVSAQRMVDLRPDLASLSRVSYLRELHGNVVGAIDAMRRAVEAGAPRTEATAWTEVQLGHLYFAMNDLDAADRSYARSVQRVDNYVYGTAGLARVRAARGDLAGSAALYEDAARRLPVPDIVIALGDVYARMGDAARAQQQFTLVSATQQLLAANGVRNDVDLALFDLDHGIANTMALPAATAEYAVRPSVSVAMVLAWAEYKAGDPVAAMRHSNEALRLGWRDPLMLYRAGAIAEAAGDHAVAAALLRASSELNPHFSTLYETDLASRLVRLQAASQ